MSDAGGETHVLHRERLWPSAGVWFLTLVPGLFTGIAAGPIDITLSITLGIVVTAVVVVALVRTSPVVEVTSDGLLRAGRAVLPARFVTGVEPARGPRARAVRGVDLDARSHLLLRGWVDPVVRVDLDDPDDPHPSWVVSTRSPDHLARAVLAVAPPSAQLLSEPPEEPLDGDGGVGRAPDQAGPGLDA